MVRFAADREKLEVLFDIYARINSTYDDVKALLTLIIESATELTEGEASSLMLVNPENNKLYFEIALGPKGPSVKQYSVNMGEGIAGWVAEKNTSLIVNDVQNDTRFYPDIARKIGFPTTSILAVPMLVKDKLVGVIEILNKRDGKKFTEEDLQWLEMFSTQAAIAVQNARSYQKVRNELSALQDKVQAVEGWHTFVGESRIIKDRLEIARKAAETDSSVLLLGESGVGKELFAEQIHLASPRRAGPFIRVNCAAIPEALLESELFGHVKGAFTDAVTDRRGRFELADGGTLFLDEIADMPLPLQAKLLRVLQEKEIRRVGDTEHRKVNVRVLAATNKDLQEEIKQQRFREDLFFRLNVVSIPLPPLRERTEDIPALVEHFLAKANKSNGRSIKGIHPDAMKMLLMSQWKGNIRELQNTIERAVVLCTGTMLMVGDINTSPQGNNTIGPEGLTLEEFERRLIESALAENDGNRTRTAQKLGVSLRWLQYRLKEWSRE